MWCSCCGDKAKMLKMSFLKTKNILIREKTRNEVE